MKTVITYGTFDLFHYGHIEMLRRAKSLADGGKLIVGLSTDEFNDNKGKKSYIPFNERKRILEAIRYVDKIIPEENWEQKTKDINENDVDIFVIGDDWRGKFDSLSSLCKVVYLPRTTAISSTLLKSIIKDLKSVSNDL